MAKFDIIIKDGMIFDGARNPRYKADVGIKDGLITEIGFLQASDADRVLDAAGKHVAPGFIDLHTHYDGQIFWDPYCSISGWHGTTSVVIGNCGFGLAPVQPGLRDRAMLALTRNEAIPLASMQHGIPWDWVSYPEYLDSLDRTDKSVNVLPYVGLTPLLIWVMGMDRAKAGELPTDEEHAEMRRLLNEAMDAGACGWSVQRMSKEINFQRDYDGTPLPTDVMHDETAIELAEVLGERNEGFIQMTLSRSVTDPSIDRRHVEQLAEITRRPIIWNAVAAFPGAPVHRDVINWLRSCIERGLRVNAQSAVTEAPMFFTFEDWNLWDDSPAWREATLGTTEERLAKLADPEHRRGMRERPTMAGSSGPIADIVLIRTSAPEHKQYENLKIQDIMALTGQDEIDAILDVACADGLKALFYCEPFGGAREYQREVVEFEYGIAGVSDGGAHTKFLTAGRYPTEYLTKWVREMAWVSLEDAHWRLSAYPAFCAGFTNRGVIRVGACADVVVYDFKELDVLPPEVVYDFPGDEWRRVQRAKGYNYVIVNGEVTIEEDKITGTAGAGCCATAAEVAGSDYIASFAAQQPDEVALIDGERSLTWAQWAERRDSVARSLQSIGIEPREAVAIYEVNSVDYFVVLSAIGLVGATSVQINWRLTPDEVLYVLGNSDAVAVFINEQYLPVVDGIVEQSGIDRWIVIGAERRSWARPFDQMIEDAVSLPSVREVGAPGGTMIYTGGTTGRPKGVRRQPPSAGTVDPAVLQAMGAFLHAMNLDRPHRHLVTAALYHQGPIGYATLALTHGGSVVIMRSFDPEEALRLIATHRCTSTFMPPVLAKRVVDLPQPVRARYDTSSMEVFVVTAGPVPQKLKEDILDTFGPVYYEAYSSTETALSATALTPADVRAHPGSCGRTVAGIGFTIRDDEGNELPRGERGLICCPNHRGSFDGYHKDADLSREVFVNDWLTVGDIGYMDEDGFLYIVDRIRDMIISGGTNIYSAEIENVLHEHPSIHDVAIIGVPDDEWGERVHAAVQLKAGATLTLDELQAFARLQLAGYKVPRGLSIHTEFPRDAAGKLAKKSLREQFNTNTNTNTNQPTRGATMAKTKSEVVTDMLHRQYNLGDITAVDDAIAENHIDHNPTHKQEQGRAGVRKLIQGMIDRGGYTCEIHDSFESGDLVCTRYTIHAEHSSDMLGLPAKGKKTSTHVVEVDRVIDGVIVESWGESAQFEMLKQLGLVSEDFPYDLMAVKAAEAAAAESH